MKCLSSLLLAGLVAGIYLSPVIHFSGGVDPAFQLLRSFSAIEQGRGPYANSALAYSGGKLFGATFQGGSANKGVVFSMSVDGSGYSVLHHFSSLSAGLNTDGAAPASTLTVSGGRGRVERQWHRLLYEHGRFRFHGPSKLYRRSAEYEHGAAFAVR